MFHSHCLTGVRRHVSAVQVVNNYFMWCESVAYICIATAPEWCVAEYGTVGCFNALLGGALPPVPSSSAPPSPPPAISYHEDGTAGKEAAGAGQGGGGGEGRGAPLGAILAGALGGAVLHCTRRTLGCVDVLMRGVERVGVAVRGRALWSYKARCDNARRRMPWEGVLLKGS